MGKKKENDFDLKFNKYRHDGEHYACPICKKKTAMLWGRCRNCGSSLTEKEWYFVVKTINRQIMVINKNNRFLQNMTKWNCYNIEVK